MVAMIMRMMMLLGTDSLPMTIIVSSILSSSLIFLLLHWFEKR
jgi:hypothetical protein